MEPVDNEMFEDEQFRRLLAHHDEPAPLATPQLLAAKVYAHLPDLPPAAALRRTRRVAMLRGAIGTLGLAAVALLLTLGSWIVLVDSTLLTQTLAGTGLDSVLLLLTLLAKPLLGLLLASPLLLTITAIMLAGGGTLWWRTLRLSPAYALSQVPR